MAQSQYPLARRGSNAPTLWDTWGDWMNRFGTPSFAERFLSTGTVAPVDVCERGNEFVVRMACAGCRPDDIEVTVENDTVRIRGKFMDHDMMMQEQGALGTQSAGGQHLSGQNVGVQHAGGQSTGSQAASGQQSGSQQMGGQSREAQQQAGGQSSGGQTMSSRESGNQQGGQMQSQREVCLIRELPVGRFERDITLPVSVNAQETQATFEYGLLTLVLPKTQAAMGHRIQIGGGTSTSGR